VPLIDACTGSGTFACVAAALLGTADVPYAEAGYEKLFSSISACDIRSEFLKHSQDNLEYITKAILNEFAGLEYLGDQEDADEKEMKRRKRDYLIKFEVRIISGGR